MNLERFYAGAGDTRHLIPVEDPCLEEAGGSGVRHLSQIAIRDFAPIRAFSRESVDLGVSVDIR
jgi:hypothetical protein